MESVWDVVRFSPVYFYNKLPEFCFCGIKTSIRSCGPAQFCRWCKIKGISQLKLKSTQNAPIRKQQAAESVHREAQFNLWAPLSWRHISMSVKQETRNQELQRTSITPIPLCVITLKPVGHFKDCVSTCVFMLLFVFPNVHNGLSVVWCVECFHVCGLLWRQRFEFNRLQLGVGAL